MKRALAVLAACLLPLAACGGSDDDDAWVLSVDGRVEVAGKEARTLDGGRHRIASGEQVRVVDGTAVLELPGDGRLELRAAVGRSEDSQVTVASPVTLEDGDALLVAGDDRVRLAAGSATVEARAGVARVRRSSGTTIAVYRGRADVEALGRELQGGLPAFRQLAIAASGRLPRRPVPLVYDGAVRDPWDLRYLGAAIDLDREVAQRARALQRDLAGREGAVRRDPGFFARVVPALAGTTGFGAHLLDPDRSVPETLVGASIALSAPGSFVDRWRSTFDFRTEGATWGLVALDQEARRAALLGHLSEAAGRLFAASGVAASSPVGTTTTSTVPPAPPPPTSAPPPPDDGGGDDDGGDDGDGPLSPVLEPLTDLLGGLIGEGGDDAGTGGGDGLLRPLSAASAGPGRSDEHRRPEAAGRGRLASPHPGLQPPRWRVPAFERLPVPLLGRLLDPPPPGD